MTAQPSSGIGLELGLLEGAGLISLAASVPELEYIFRHALIQDAAYELILRRDRRSLHAQVAENAARALPGPPGRSGAHACAPFRTRRGSPEGDRIPRQAARHARSRFARHEAVDFARRAVAMLPGGDAISVEERRTRADMLLSAG